MSLSQRYRLRWKRRRLLWRSFRSRHALTALSDRTSSIRPNDILCVCTLRNEMLRLPYFLQHHRALGVTHFLCVDNDSTDGTADWLATQPDVSVWTTTASYRAARFGLDWMTWLQMRYAPGHWCLMLDVDELFVYDGSGDHGLRDLTAHLERQGRVGYGALMVDLYPKGPLSGADYAPGTDPTKILNWFDPDRYRKRRQKPLQNLWVQGGPRDRAFFHDDPRRAPTLNKLPLIKWDKRFAYVNSCHSALPPRLNLLYDGPGTGGALLHTKFLPDASARATEEKHRREHFHRPESMNDYYDAVIKAPDLWFDGAKHYAGTQSLREAGLISAINWEISR